MKLNQYQRAKLNKILIIVAVTLVVLAIIALLIYISAKNEKENQIINFEDTIVGKNLYEVISIDTETKEVTRDGLETNLEDEYGIDSTQEELLLSSTEELNKYFEDSTIEVEIQDKTINLRDKYQTKTIFVEADSIKDTFDGESITIQEGLYMLRYDTEKRTKAAYDFLKQDSSLKTVELDQVSLIKTINDESQTVYGDVAKEDTKNKTFGVSAMGLDNYKKIIKDNGNPADITIATIGYGAAIDHSFLKDRISDKYYNFIDDEKQIHETIPQGSRTLEVIKESTSDNVKILPLVVINDENYTTTSSIIQAITYATKEADVICYEFTHSLSHFVDLVLENAFNNNVPICCVTKMVSSDDEQNYPANNRTTIAVSSVDKYLKTTSYSGSGEYIDFVASSTDIQEIFNTSSNVSKWSGAEYSNAHLASLICLIKTYNKEATILEIYNILRNYCQDLGDKGKDIIYGYGFPNFSNIKIADIDKTIPVLNEEDIKVDDEKWEKVKNIQVKATDNIKIFGWNVVKTKDVPKDWNKIDKNTATIDVSSEIKENGLYYIWVTDSAGNAAYVSKEITKIDNTPPTIEYTIDDSKKDTEKYITITVTAKDEQVGLHEMSYSWDKQSWGKDNNFLRVTENGSYTIYVRDALENIAEKKITINSLPKEGTAEIDDGTLIKSINVSSEWSGNTNKEVIIILNNNLSIQDWQITEFDEVPERFRPSQDEDEESNTTAENTTLTNTNTSSPIINNSQGNTNTTITAELKANIQYYLWVKDSAGNILSQSFTIRK